MAQLAIKTVDPAPDHARDMGPAIDREHLARMTFGDRSLERELLQLFDRQSEILIARMRAGDPSGMATLAHTVKGSAAGIGAGRVARAADAAERAAGASAAEFELAVSRLASAVAEARARIAELLGNDNEGIARVAE